MSTNNESFNADELVAPEWLNGQFLTEVLGNYEKAPELNVVDVQMSPASGKGDHYASIMFRANVSYTTSKGVHSKPLIIKTMPEQDGHKKDMLADSYLFETEIGMYTKVLPMFEAILKEANDETRLGAKCLYHSLKPRQVMVFEDLLPQGYSVVRDRPATIEELKGAFTKLAKLHAVSMKVLNETPDFLKEFKHGLCDMQQFLKDPFLTKGIGNFIEFLDKVPELTKYKPYFKSIEKNFMQSFIDIMEEYRNDRQPNGYYILSHGDFHLRNMMFRSNKEDGTFEDCMLVDYQICNVCPITIDLICSIHLVMSPEDRQNSCDELIKYYFSTFVETLKKIGFKGELPKFAELQKQMFRHKFYEMFLISSLLPLLHGVRSNAFDIPEMLQNNEVRKKLYLRDEYIKDVKFLLAKFEKLGYFEK